MSDEAPSGILGPSLLLSVDKVQTSHCSRDAYVYVRQSTPSQVINHTESLARQYEPVSEPRARVCPAQDSNGAGFGCLPPTPGA